MLAKNTHDKYRKYRKNNKCNKIPDLERKEAERFQRAKNILVTFAIFADISGFFLASFVSKSWFLLDLLFLRFCDICKWFSHIIFSQSFLLRQLRRKIASKFLLTRSILDISPMAKKKKTWNWMWLFSYSKFQVVFVHILDEFSWMMFSERKRVVTA